MRVFGLDALDDNKLMWCALWKVGSPKNNSGVSTRVWEVHFVELNSLQSGLNLLVHKQPFR